MTQEHLHANVLEGAFSIEHILQIHRQTEQIYR